MTNNFTVKRFEINPPIPYNTSKTFIGYDPGTIHSGFAVLYPNNTVRIYQVSSERDANPINRMLLVRKIWRSMQLPLPFYFTTVIEGASYSSNYRQVELAEVRTAFAVELAKWDTKLVDYDGSNINIISPLSIRKTVFGNAKTKAHEVWTNLYDINTLEIIDPKKYPDALAALSCAYYGVMTYE